MSNNNIKAIALGGIFATIYGILTVLSIYTLPILSIFTLMIMPIFAAYYSSIYSFKNTIIFNIATVFICFILGIGDLLFTILYIVPTLIVGDVYGLINKKNIPLYTSIFLQCITYSITNVLALYLSEAFYDVKIIELIIADEFIYENFSLTILFVLSSAEAIFSSMFIYEQLNKLKIKKEKEKSMPIYGYIAYIIIYLLMILFTFVYKNAFYLMCVFELILCVPLYFQIEKKVKYKNIFFPLFIILYISICFFFCYLKLFEMIFFTLYLFGLLYCIVKILNYLYNERKV